MSEPMRRAALALLLAACGGKSTPQDQTPVSLAIASSAGTLTVAVGGALQLSVTSRNSVGSAVAPPLVSWASSDPTVATVDSAGKVTGVAAGTADVTAASTAPALQAKAAVTVSDPNAITVQWSLDAETTTVVTTINAGQTVQWHNTDTAHSVVPDATPPPQSEGPAAAGAIYGAQVFATKGTFHYHCGIHPTMSGTVVVQ